MSRSSTVDANEEEGKTLKTAGRGPCTGVGYFAETPAGKRLFGVSRFASSADRTLTGARELEELLPKGKLSKKQAVIAVDENIGTSERGLVEGVLMKWLGKKPEVVETDTRDPKPPDLVLRVEPKKKGKRSYWSVLGWKGDNLE